MAVQELRTRRAVPSCVRHSPPHLTLQVLRTHMAPQQNARPMANFKPSNTLWHGHALFCSAVCRQIRRPACTPRRLCPPRCYPASGRSGQAQPRAMQPGSATTRSQNRKIMQKKALQFTCGRDKPETAALQWRGVAQERPQDTGQGYQARHYHSRPLSASKPACTPPPANTHSLCSHRYCHSMTQ